MKAQDLKNSILQLAVQGKLVKQDPNDEPASVLLERIKAERERLVKEKKIKADKVSSFILRGEDGLYYENVSSEVKCIDDEIPFEIPDSWAWVRLKTIINYNIGGGTPSKSNSSYWNGSIKWASVKDLNCEYLSETIDHITELGLKNSSSNIIPKGNIIVCIRMGLGKIVINKDDIAINQDLRGLIISPFINKKYFVNFYRTQIITGQGLTVKGITVDTLNQILLPLPPFAEQQRIVEKIESLLPVIYEYGEAERELTALNNRFPDDLKKTILQAAVQGKLVEQDPADEPAAVLLERIKAEKEQLIKEKKIKKDKVTSFIFKGEDGSYCENLGGQIKCIDDEIPFEIPESWAWVRLGNIGQVQTGTTPPTTHPEYFGKDIPFIKPADISCSGINYDNEGLSFEGISKSRLISKSSVLMVCIGGSTGKCYFTDRDITCNQQINTITPLLIDVQYLFFAMMSDYFFKTVWEKATGTATPIINKGFWSTQFVPIPPMAEQTRIVEKVNSLLAMRDKLSS